MDTYNQRLSFIWSVKDTLRDSYRRHQYREVILPFAVLRRLDCVLKDTKDAVVEAAGSYPREYIDGEQRRLTQLSGENFYNTSAFTFETLVGEEAEQLYDNFIEYMNGFSKNIRDTLERFNTWSEVKRLNDLGLLFAVVRHFAEVDLHPRRVSNILMGQIYEELIRRTADLSNEEAGEHYTPREVIRLMVDLLLSADPQLTIPHRIFTVYDPACGTGGMLSEAERFILEKNDRANVHLFGQEVSPETWALCQSDMLISGNDPKRISFGSTLSADAFPTSTFHYMLANPPYGKKWETDRIAVEREHADLGDRGRFGIALPKISDGQILFLQNMLAKMRAPAEGGSRIAIIMSYSPLSNGDAGERENRIRQWIIENDLLDCVVALPENLFYNTPIYTCIWIISNGKPRERQNFVQLIDARDLFNRLRWPLGKKRCELSEEHIAEVLRAYESGAYSSRSRMVPRDRFGYRKITVARPLRLRWDFSKEPIGKVIALPFIAKLPQETRDSISDKLAELAGSTFRDFSSAERALKTAFSGVRATPAQRKRVLDAFSVRDPSAEVIRDRDGVVVADPDEQEDEYVPLDIDTETFMETEVLPWSPEAFVLPGSETVGYEIPVTVWFHEYQAPRALSAIQEDVDRRKSEVSELLELFGGSR